MKFTIRLFLILFGLGFLGVLSLLFSDLLAMLPEEGMRELENIPHLMIKLSTLITPTFLLIIFIIIGIATFQQCGYKLPFIIGIFTKESFDVSIKSVVKYGLLGGIVAFLVIAMVGYIYRDQLPAEFLALEQKLSLHPLTRLMYGGVTEEILIRFGLMSLLTFILYKLAGGRKEIIYWIAVIGSSILFALGHLPITFTLVEEVTTALVLYILLGNFLAGCVFGWLYWKKGLESAIVAHIVTHLFLLIFTL